MARPHRIAAILSTFFCGTGLLLPPAAAQPELAAVLQRAAGYVDALHDQLITVVMEERYEQRLWAARRPGPRPAKHVVLRSDYFLVRLEGAVQPYGFRDVFEADGVPVRDRDERLAGLFRDPSATATEQIIGILRESARYNIGEIERNTNTPTLALVFLSSTEQPRSEFERVADPSPGFAGSNAFVVGFREGGPATLVHSLFGEALPATGHFWIEPATGRVLATELAFRDRSVHSVTSVRYAPSERLGHLVPVEMRETYHNLTTGNRITGAATYTNFRQWVTGGRVVEDGRGG